LITVDAEAIERGMSDDAKRLAVKTANSPAGSGRSVDPADRKDPALTP
jgi:hypothetical protein